MGRDLGRQGKIEAVSHPLAAVSMSRITIPRATPDKLLTL
jgi:hypothetical protein